MSEQLPPGRQRPTRHRAGSSSADLLRRFAPPLVAVASVVAVILLLLVLNARPTPPGPAPGAVAQPPTAATAPALSSPPALGTPSPSLSSVSTSASTVAAPPVSEPPATQAPLPAARPAVTVLNNSRRNGLAKAAAAQLRAKGWPVARTGNFRGRISASTVYYAAGQRAAAEELARSLPQVHRVLPRFAGLPGSGMTLVVTRDWSA